MKKGQSKAQMHMESRQLERQVLELRTAGYSYEAISEQVGYETPAAAHKAWKRAVNRIPEQAAEEFRTTELERLDKIQRSIWRRAIEQQDPKLLAILLKVIDKRMSLLGLAKLSVKLEGAGAVTVAQVAQLLGQTQDQNGQVAHEPAEQSQHFAESDRF